MTLDTVVRDLVDKIVSERLEMVSSIEMITVQEAAEICGCDKSVIHSLVNESERNGFPSIRLSPRIIKIDKQGLVRWLRAGGLNGVSNKDQ